MSAAYVTRGELARTVRLTAVIFVTFVATIAAAFALQQYRAGVAEREVCERSTRAAIVATDLIEENSRLLELNFRDLVAAREARGEPQLAAESEKLRLIAETTRDRVAAVRDVFMQRRC